MKVRMRRRVSAPISCEISTCSPKIAAKHSARRSRTRICAPGNLWSICVTLAISCLGCARLRAKDLVESFEHERQVLRRRIAEPLPQPIRRERAELADLHPRPLGEGAAGELV